MFVIRPRFRRSFHLNCLALFATIVVWPARAHDRTTLASLIAGRQTRPYKTRPRQNPGPRTVRLFKHRDAEGTWLIRIREAGSARELAHLFAEEITGANLARIVGGPRLRRRGFIEELNAFFLEKERLFVGEETWTYRGCQDAPCLRFMRRVLGSQLVERLARRFVHVLEANLAPNEHNFIFTRGDVRWIDGESWRETGDSTEGPVHPALVETLLWLNRIEPRRAHEFDRHFLHEVIDSLVWSEAQKESLLVNYAVQTRALPELAPVLGALPVRGCNHKLVEPPSEALPRPN